MSIWIGLLQGNRNSQNMKDIDLKMLGLIPPLGNSVLHVDFHGKSLYLLYAGEKHRKKNEAWFVIDFFVVY